MTPPAQRATGWFAAEGLDVRYGDRYAIRRLNLRLPAATMIAVTGSSGAGKSSLLWALAGALTPSAGTISLDGVPIGSREAASRLGIAFMPQGGGLASTLTATENVVISLSAQAVCATEARRRAEEALLAVGLPDEGGHLPEELSGGQQQRAAVAVLLASRARVLLLDEPTSELDALNRQRILACLRTETSRGAIVVLATHDPEAADPADALLALDEGVGTWHRALQDEPTASAES